MIQSKVQAIESDVRDIKETQNEHSQILNKYSRILDEHSRILNRLDAKTDSIAETVMINDKRLITVEKEVVNLRGGFH